MATPSTLFGQAHIPNSSGLDFFDSVVEMIMVARHAQPGEGADQVCMSKPMCRFNTNQRSPHRLRPGATQVHGRKVDSAEVMGGCCGKAGWRGLSCENALKKYCYKSGLLTDYDLCYNLTFQ